MRNGSSDHPAGIPTDDKSDAERDPLPELPGRRQHPVVVAAIVVAAVAMVAGLLMVVAIIALWLWIMASGGLFPNK